MRERSWYDIPIQDVMRFVPTEVRINPIVKPRIVRGRGEYHNNLYAETENIILQFLDAYESISERGIAHKTGISRKNVRRHIRDLMKVGKIIRLGKKTRLDRLKEVQGIRGVQASY